LKASADRCSKRKLGGTARGLWPESTSFLDRITRTRFFSAKTPRGKERKACLLGGFAPLRLGAPTCVGPPRDQRLHLRIGLAAGLHCMNGKLIAVGTGIAARPPQRSVREELPHTAPTLSRARNRWFGQGCKTRGRGRWRRITRCIRDQVQRSLPFWLRLRRTVSQSLLTSSTN
jgi:hypothetical protein